MISIVITVYNKEEHIEECLKSVISQKLKEIEIIIINDGSTDGSEEIIKRYLYDDRIVYIYQDNMGIAYTRNKGIEMASFPYIFFLDGDDFIYSHSIYALSKHLLAEPDVVVGNFLYKNENKLVKNTSLIERTISNVMELKETKTKYDMFVSSGRPLSSACNKLYKLEYLRNNDISFESGVISEDRLFNLYVYSYNPYIVITNEYTYIVNMSPNSRSRSKFESFYETSILLFQKYYNFLEKKLKMEENFDLLYFTLLNDIEKIHSHIVTYSNKKFLDGNYYTKLLFEEKKINEVIKIGTENKYFKRIKQNRKAVFLRIYSKLLSYPCAAFCYYYLYRCIMNMRKSLIFGRRKI